MTGEDRAIVGLALLLAISLFLLAASARRADTRIAGFFFAAIIAWGGVAYAYVAITAGAAR